MKFLKRPPKTLRRKSPNLELSLLLTISILYPSFLIAQSDLEKELFGYLNSERERENLKPLVWNKTLHKVALAHSRDMAQMGQVSHDSSDGTKTQERVKKSGVFSSQLGENVARDIHIVAVHTSLMESLNHRKNILNPGYTDVAVGVVVKGRYLYVTEIFIRGVDDYTLEDARLILLNQMNEFRERRGLGKLAQSMTLNDIAQSHVNLQERASSLGPPLIMGLLARQEGGPLRASIYTTFTISNFPEEVQQNLALKIQSVGIGFKRIRGDLCKTGCFLITLMFGPEAS